MTPEPIIIDGRLGTVVYLNAEWHPVSPEQATMARVLFDDGGSAFYVAQSVAQKFDPSEPRDERGRWTADAVGQALIQAGRTTTNPNSTFFLLHDGTRVTAAGYNSHAKLAAAAGYNDLNKVIESGVVRYIPGVGIEANHLTETQARIVIDDWKTYFAEHALQVDLIGRDDRLVLPTKERSHRFDRLSVDALLNFVNGTPAGLGGLTRKFDAALHPRGEDGRFIEATQPRIFNRPEEVAKVISWGDVTWRWKDKETGQPSGSLLTGAPIPREKLPETLYHVTTNAPAVESSGVLLGLLESGGLGGGQAEGVSFTTSKEDARVIQRELTRSVSIARGEVDEKAFEQWARADEKEAGLPEGSLDYATKNALQQWEGNKHILRGNYVSGKGYTEEAPYTPEEHERIRRSVMKDVFNSYLWARETAAEKATGHKVESLKNPILFGQQEHLAKLHPENVQILEIPSKQIPEGALVTTGSDKFLHEVRAYSDVPLLKKLHSIAKFDPNQPRDPAGVPTGGQFAESSHSAAAATPDPALAKQAESGIAAVEKLMPEAIKTANYEESFASWGDVPKGTQSEVYYKWQEDAIDNYSNDDYSSLDRTFRDDLERENQGVLDAAIERTTTMLSEKFQDTAPTLPVEGTPFQLKRTLDPDTIDYGAGEHINGVVALDLEALRFTSGESLTPAEQQIVRMNWDVAYRNTFSDEMTKVFQSDRYLEAIQKEQEDLMAEEWQQKSGDEKFNLMQDYLSRKQIQRVGIDPRAPDQWVTGVQEEAKSDKNYQLTHAVALRLTELRTDELRKERGLLDPGVRPTYTIKDTTAAHGTPTFVIMDEDGNRVGGSNTLERATANAEEWATDQSTKAAQVKTPQLINAVWDSWKEKSSSGFGLSLQLAAANEFGGHHRMTTEEVAEAMEYAKDYGGMPTLQAYVRAQWEVTQTIMKKAGEDKLDVYRAIMLPGEKVKAETTARLDKLGGPIEPPKNIKVFEQGIEAGQPTPSGWSQAGKKTYVSFDYMGDHFVVEKEVAMKRPKYQSITEIPKDPDEGYVATIESTEEAIQRRVNEYHQSVAGQNVFTKLPDIKLQRAGAQSTTGTRSVANDWAGVGNLPDDPTRVVLRIEAPATSVLSLPVYGKNIIGEHESVLMGTKDKWLWDAWRERAPDFESHSISGKPKSPKPLVMDWGKAIDYDSQMVHKTDTEPLTIDLQAEDRGKPHWMTGIDWGKPSYAAILTNGGAVVKWDEGRHPREAKGGPKGGEFTRVAMTSQRAPGDPGHQSNKVVFQHMREFQGQLEALKGVSKVSVKPGVGGWEGGSESMWQIYYKGNGEARKLVARTAKQYNQDAVLILNKCHGKDCQPAVELSFEGGVTPAAREHVHQVLVAHGIGGWTWMKRDGKTVLRMVSVPQWGGEGMKHQQATTAVSQELRGGGLANRRRVHQVAVSVMEREGKNSYDSVIGA